MGLPLQRNDNLPPAKDCQACFYNIRKSIRQATTRMVKAGEL
jgi:hypothetical protein